MQDLEVTEGELGGVPVRFYRPAGDSAAELVFAHGGGFSWGTLDDYDPICRNLCRGTGSVVISVNYRLAPAHPFPAGLDDVCAVCREVLRDAGSSQAILAGDSAGGGLAAGAAQRLRAEGIDGVAGQLLIYPMLEYHSRTPAEFHALSERYHPSFAAVRDAWDRYLQAEVERLPSYAVPPRTEELSGLPPTLTLLAEHDPLRFEAMQYAARLAGSGVPSKLRDYSSTMHGFLNAPATPGGAVEQALADIREWLLQLQ